jgi:multiple sugar transport system substrate-binding protein
MARPLILLLALLPACLLGACQPKTPPPVQLQVFGDAPELAAYRSLLDEFERTHPGQKVELLAVGKQKDHMAKLVTRMAAGDPPDLFIVNFRRYGQFAERGALAPLGPRLAATGAFKAEEFYAPPVEAFTWDGELMCIPQNVSSLVIYYNRGLFKRFDAALPHADWNLRELQDAAIRITRRARGAGDKDIYGLGIEPSLIRLAPFVWAFGGDLVNDLRRPSLITLDRGRAPFALEFIKRLRQTLQVTPALADVKAEDLESRFARGALGMIVHSRRYTTTLRALDPAARAKLDWDVAPFPRLGEEPGPSSLHGDAWCMARDARNPEAAEKLVAFATSVHGQTLLARTGRSVPSRIAVAESPVFLDPDQPPASARVFLDAVPRLRRTPNVAVWNEVETRADAVLEEWYYEQPIPGSGYVDADGGAEGLRGGAWVARETQDILVRGLRESAKGP